MKKKTMMKSILLTFMMTLTVGVSAQTTWVYTYDAVGNRTQRTVTGSKARQKSTTTSINLIDDEKVKAVMDPSLKKLKIETLSFGPENYTATWKDHLFVHEYGHYIQGQIYGGLFIPLIGGPSLMSAMGIGGPQHDKRWFEVDASKKGGKYFDKLYGQGKKGYVKNSKDYFDITSFQDKGKSPYVNPRTGTLYQDTANPIHGSEHSIWDYLSPLVTLLVL